MGIIVYKNKIINSSENEKRNNESEKVGYLHASSMELDFNKYKINNFRNDIVIKSNNNIYLKIPTIENKEKRMIKGILKNSECILGYEGEEFVEFLNEKIYLHGSIDSKDLILYLLEYFCLKYIEDLLEVEEQIDELFQRFVDEEENDTKNILRLKKQVSLIKRYTTYYKSMLSYLDNEFSDVFIYDKVQFVLDNTMNLVENVESSIFACVDIYNSVQSNKMNKTMQLLTIITVISLPLTIVSGIFGMNFEDMPLLKNSFGFLIAAFLTLTIIIFEIIYFKKKNFFK
ncbi:MAG: CorA family divalent cation transporter [Clostridium sp.]